MKPLLPRNHKNHIVATIHVSPTELVVGFVIAVLVLAVMAVPPLPALRVQPVATGDLPNRTGGHTSEPRVTVSFLDVQDGMSVLIQAETRCALLDTGGLFNGEVVTELVRSRCSSGLDYLIMTYTSPEHCGGALALLHDIAVETFVAPAVDSRDWVYRRVVELLAYYRVKVVQSQRDLVIELGPGVTLRPLGPFAEVFAEGQFAPGDQSLAWLLAVGNVHFLFASDLTAAGEHLLIRVMPDLRADVLMVANHGDRQSTSTVFLEAINPSFAVVSSGGLPGDLSEQVLSRLKAKGIVTLRTDVLGNIIVRSDGRQLAWYSQKRGEELENLDYKR